MDNSGSAHGTATGDSSICKDKKKPRRQGWTYIRPSKKTPDTANFCFFDIRRTQTMGNGMTKIIMSMTMLTIPTICAPRTAGLQLLLSSHKALMGCGRHCTSKKISRTVK